MPAIASLALGIAVNTTMFSVVNAVLLRPIAASSTGNLVRIGRSVRNDQSFRSASHEELVYIRDHATSLAHVAGHQLETLAVAHPEGAEAVSAEMVTTNYFAALGVGRVLGRGFSPDDDRGAAVVVASHRFWRRRYGADPALIGRRILLNGHPFTVVGVAPAGFTGTFPGVDVDLWLPAMMANVVANRPDRRGPPSLMLLGRLKPGVRLEDARAELRILGQRMADEDPTRDRDRRFVVAEARGAHPLFARIARMLLAVLMATVGIVLLVACVNVAVLLLARAGERRVELAVRVALGASRARVVGQLLVEGLLLALLGGLSGLLLAYWAIGALNAFVLTTGTTGAPVFFDLKVDTRVLAFTAAVTMAATLAFGLLPALRAARMDVISGLKDSASARGGQLGRWRGALVIVQVAFSFLLLVAAGLLMQSLRGLDQVDLGFDPDHVVTASFDLQPLGYEAPRGEAFYELLLHRTRTLPNVERAALAELLPMGDRRATVALAPPHVTARPEQDPITVPCSRVSDDYFRAMRQRLVRGRDFTSRDRSGAPMAVIVNEALARRFWPGQEPLGKRLRLAEEGNELEVVGVAGDAKYASFAGVVEPFIFLPLRQRYRPALTLQVRTTSEPEVALAQIRRLVGEIDAGVALRNGGTLRDRMAFTLVPARIAQGVFGIAGALALALATGGLYGLVAYTLAWRMKEIGIRVALGAAARDIFGLLVGGVVRLTAAGLVLGAALALMVTRFLSPLLNGMSARDPWTFGAIGTLLILVTLGAGYVAARRGLAVDPMAVLRRE